MKEKQVRINNDKEALKAKNDAIWAMDKDFLLTAFNNAFKERFKKEFQEDPQAGLNLRSYYKKSIFFRTCEQGCERALDRYATSARQSVGVNEDAEVIEFFFQPYMDTSGKVTGCCIWQKCLSHEVENILRLKESERKYKETQAIGNVGHWSWDMTKDEITWSDQIFRIYGQVPGKFEATYGALMELIHPEDREAFNEDVQRCIKEKLPHDSTNRIIVGDGEIRYLQHKGRAFYDTNGNPMGMAGITRDVTKDILANQQIVQQNHELQNFIRIISHNLRGPISNLLMLSKIYDWGKDEMNDDIVRKIEQTTEALDQTIKDLSLSLSLKNAEKEQFREIALTDVMKDVDALLAEEVTDSNAIIRTDFSKAETILGLKAYLVNIVYNLILNAIHYGKEEVSPIIEIRTQATDDGITLEVSDNGIGMELTPEREKKIFDLYGRLSGTTEGKGLGLYLVKTQVEAMEGKIEVRSEKDVGTTFAIHFKK